MIVTHALERVEEEGEEQMMKQQDKLNRVLADGSGLGVSWQGAGGM
jgi:hypothetical protein